MPRLSIFQKLFFSLLLSNLVLIVGMAYIVNLHLEDGLRDYLNREDYAKAEHLASEVSRYYSTEFGWGLLRQSKRIWPNLLKSVDNLPAPHNGHNSNGKGDHKQALPFSGRMMLLDMNRKSIVPDDNHRAFKVDTNPMQEVAVMHNGNQVAWIVFPYSDGLSNALAENFFKSQTKNLLAISLITFLLTLFVAYILVRYFLRPLKSLNTAAKSAKSGDYDVLIEYHSKDEIRDLVDSFNELIKSLGKQKELRGQWLSDIAHELRTPLAILQGELEAIIDGIRKPESQYLLQLHQQIINLNKLVNDLHDLSVADSSLYLIQDKRKIELTELFKDICQTFRLRFLEKNIGLSCYVPDAKVYIQGESKRLRQLFTNILENSYRYTYENGQVRARLTAEGNTVVITIEDSAPTVPDESLPKLFDRLYRVSKSRSRSLGGSGLGLSICKSIVEMHQGNIEASYSKMGGVKISMTFQKII